jgi:site-specific DNA-methyltransferase (adenine-specific)
VESETQLIIANSLEWLRKQGDNAYDFSIQSPPYADKGNRYGGIAKKWPLKEWVPWMLEYVVELTRVTKGLVMLVVNSRIHKAHYEPSVELLLCETYKLGILCERPLIWLKNSPPNRNGVYFSNTHEHILAFASEPGFFFDWMSIATEQKYANGGDFCQRGQTGKRTKGSKYPQGPVRPRDVIQVPVGGGLMGWDRACKEGEAPYPENLIEPLIKSCCPVGGTVLDVFVGSGTTAAVARRLGRGGIGIDIREEAIELSRRRLSLDPPQPQQQEFPFMREPA